MLIEFRVANFRSFGEEQVLSLVASKDTAHPGNLIPGERFNLLKAAGLFGANASGKSNLVKAMGFMAWFVCDSATKMNIGDEIDVVPFLLSAGAGKQPSRFEVVLSLEGVRYDYGFSATRQRVCEEWLTAYPQGRPQRWFQRRLDPEKGETKWTFRGPLKGNVEGLLRERTRDNGLVLSRGAELNVAELTPVFQWFRTGLFVVDLSTEDVPSLVDSALHSLQESPESWGRAMRLLRDVDVGIEDVHVTQLPPLPDPFALLAINPVLSSSASKTPGTMMMPTFTFTIASPPGQAKRASDIRSVHRVAEDGGLVQFGFFDAESLGTQRFLGVAGVWLSAVDNGSCVFVDELDCSLHPLLTRKLLQFFQDPRENTRGAQLVFVTHDSTLMDLSLLRRDQIWIVEKDAGHASRLFSLYDIQEKPRKGEAVEKRYLAGRYGGVPMFGPTLENLESP